MPSSNSNHHYQEYSHSQCGGARSSNVPTTWRKTWMCHWHSYTTSHHYGSDYEFHIDFNSPESGRCSKHTDQVLCTASYHAKSPIPRVISFSRQDQVFPLLHSSRAWQLPWFENDATIAFVRVICGDSDQVLNRFMKSSGLTLSTERPGFCWRAWEASVNSSPLSDKNLHRKHIYWMWKAFQKYRYETQCSPRVGWSYNCALLTSECPEDVQETQRDMSQYWSVQPLPFVYL